MTHRLSNTKVEAATILYVVATFGVYNLQFVCLFV